MKKLITILLSCTLLSSFWLFSCSFKPGGKVNLTKAQGTKNVAAKGYDVTEYFISKRPIKGKAKNSYKYKGATYFFATSRNLNTFKTHPEKYAPQYGGYCAFGVAVANKKIDIDPKAWYVKNNKLYLNYSKPTQEIWLENLEANIENGDENWKTLKNK